MAGLAVGEKKPLFDAIASTHLCSGKQQSTFDFQVINSVTGDSLLHYGAKLPSIGVIEDLLNFTTINPISVNYVMKTALQYLPKSHKTSRKLLLRAERGAFVKALQQEDSFDFGNEIKSSNSTYITQKSTIMKKLDDSSMISRPSTAINMSMARLKISSLNVSRTSSVEKGKSMIRLKTPESYPVKSFIEAKQSGSELFLPDLNRLAAKMISLVNSLNDTENTWTKNQDSYVPAEPSISYQKRSTMSNTIDEYWDKQTAVVIKSSICCKILDYMKKQMSILAKMRKNKGWKNPNFLGKTSREVNLYLELLSKCLFALVEAKQPILLRSGICILMLSLSSLEIEPSISKSIIGKLIVRSGTVIASNSNLDSLRNDL